MNKLLTGETTNFQLQQLAKKLGLYINAIVYVEQLKYVPVPTAEHSNYIINLHHPAHWCALHINRKKGYWFNSYASIMPIPTEVIMFLKRCKCTMYYDSDKSVQKSSESHCGEFSLDFLMYMNRKGDPTVNYENFLSHLHSTNKENISYVIRH